MGQFSKISLVEISNSWYPLVNKHFANWKITMLFLWVNPRTFDWAIFNSYVKLPEGRWRMDDDGSSLHMTRRLGHFRVDSPRLCKRPKINMNSWMFTCSHDHLWGIVT